MKRTQKSSKKVIKRKVTKTIGSKVSKSVADKINDVQKLVHSLQVYQIELEHQNQELRITEEELEESRTKYINLFDFSPIPYFTLDSSGIIKEVNLNAAKMLGIDRNKLIGSNIKVYVPLEEKTDLNTFIKKLFNSTTKQSCKLKVINKDKRVFYVLLEGIKSDNIVESDQQCQIALIDLTEYKKLEDLNKELSEELTLLRAAKK